jgi:hypothetical protein
LDLKFALSGDGRGANFKSKEPTGGEGFLVSFSAPKFVGARLKRLRTSEPGHWQEDGDERRR